jgi:hypothetical protein
VSIPGQVLPLVIATTGKLAEAREVQRAAAVIEDLLDASSGAALAAAGS